jgi:hypothetical protein
MDWTDLKSVIAYARRLGPGMVVVKHDSRKNYNITHAARTDLYEIASCTVHFRT